MLIYFSIAPLHGQSGSLRTHPYAILWYLMSKMVYRRCLLTLLTITPQMINSTGFLLPCGTSGRPEVITDSIGNVELFGRFTMQCKIWKISSNPLNQDEAQVMEHDLCTENRQQDDDHYGQGNILPFAAQLIRSTDANQPQNQALYESVIISMPMHRVLLTKDKSWRDLPLSIPLH